MLQPEGLTNDALYGEGHRRLGKSLSEAANCEGIHYDLYDLDRFPQARHHEIKIQRVPSFDLAEDEYRLSPYDVRDNSGSSEVFLEESPKKYKKSVLHKTLSEGEILQEKKRAMILSSGYVDVDINGYHGSEEDLIEPQCIEECSVDLSHSRIFSQESLIDEDLEDEECFHENFFTDEGARASSEGRRVSVVSSDSDMKSVDGNELRNENLLQHQLDVISSEAPQVLEDESPDVSPIELPSIQDPLDAFEESVSESQVTVVQRKFGYGGSGYVLTSDSDNGTIHTGKTLYVKQNSLHGSSLEEEDDEDVSKLKEPTTKMNSTNLSYISDEQTSASDYVISESSQGRASPSSTSSEYDKAIASSTDEYSSIISGDSMTVKSDGFDRDFEDQDLIIEENYLERLVQELKGSQFTTSQIMQKSPSLRKRISPDSDSSSSHYTEHDVSRGTLTVNSKSDGSRTDSNITASRSETSDDYITANDGSSNDVDNKRPIPYDERHVSSPPSMEDIVEDEVVLPKYKSQSQLKSLAIKTESNDGMNSDFETALDLTSPVSDSTTSASYNIDLHEDFEKVPEKQNKPDLPPKLGHALLKRPTVPAKPERFSPGRESKERPLKLDGNKAAMIRTISDNSAITRSVNMSMQSNCLKNNQENTNRVNKQSLSRTVSNMENKRFSRYFDIDSTTPEDSCDNHGDGEDSDSENQQDMWSEKDKVKLKLGMKLEFSSGTSESRKQKLSENKLKKSVKIDIIENKNALVTNSINYITQSPIPSDRKTAIEKSKTKTPDEATTPGMVRSPAMHEGFRTQDWTPLRTPGTPEKLIDLDTSEDSGTDHSPRLPKARSPNRILKELRRKSKEILRKEDVPSSSATMVVSRSPNWYNSSQEKVDPNGRGHSPNIWQDPRLSPNIATYRKNSLMRESPVPTDLDLKPECHSTLCTQCGERPASREGMLRSTPSPQQMMAAHAAQHQQFAHQFYVMQKSPSLPQAYHPEMSMSLTRPKPLPLRARSEERSALGREWGYVLQTDES